MLSFPFPFRTFRKIAETFPSCRLLLSWERKGPFTFRKIAETFPTCNLSWERKGPFPVATFPGKGKDLSQLTTFLGKDGTFTNMNKIDLLLQGYPFSRLFTKDILTKTDLPLSLSPPFFGILQNCHDHLKKAILHYTEANVPEFNKKLLPSKVLKDKKNFLNMGHASEKRFC